jgi:hypothetical protein
MSRIRVFSYFFALTAILLTAGCFDYSEKISFDEKGAGKIQLQLDLGDLSTVEKMFAWTVKKNPINEEDAKKGLPTGVRMMEFKEEVKNERKTYFVTYEFDELNKLAAWKAGDKDDLIFKNLSLKKIDDTWVFERLVKYKDEDQLKNAKKHLSRAKLVFKLTGPGKLVAEKSNPQRVEDEGKTCVWEGNFAELIEGKDGNGTVFRAHYFVGTPMWIKLALGGAVLLVLLIGAVVFMGKKKQAAA